MTNLRASPKAPWSILAVGALLACNNGGPHVSRQLAADTPIVLRPVPDIRGRSVCALDSVASALGRVPTTICDLGEGQTITLHRDTVVGISRTLPLPAPDNGEPLLDYWNRHLRDVWELRLGRRPDGLTKHLTGEADHFEAIWDEPSGVRHLVTLVRPIAGDISLTSLSVDCRETDRDKRPIACW